MFVLHVIIEFGYNCEYIFFNLTIGIMLLLVFLNNELSDFLNGEYKRSCSLDQFSISLQTYMFIIIYKPNDFLFVAF
jgi:hypothetical protein